MARSEHFLALPFQLRPIEFHLHQLVHILQDQHVAVQLNHAVVLYQTERGQFGPAVIEPGVIAVVDVDFWEQVLDALFWDSTRLESSMAFGRERIRIESNERVFGADFLEGEIKGEEARDVVGVCYESCPH